MMFEALYNQLSKTYPFVEVFCDPLNDYKISWYSRINYRLMRPLYTFQPEIQIRAVDIIHADQHKFKDLDKNVKLDDYENWRQPVEN
jgi:hypothetical protein